MDNREKSINRGTLDQLEDLRTQLCIHVCQIGTMVNLGEEAALASSGGHKIKIEWCDVFGIIGDIQKKAFNTISEMDALIMQQRHAGVKVPQDERK